MNENAVVGSVCGLGMDVDRSQRRGILDTIYETGPNAGYIFIPSDDDDNASRDDLHEIVPFRVRPFI